MAEGGFGEACTSGRSELIVVGATWVLHKNNLSVTFFKTLEMVLFEFSSDRMKQASETLICGGCTCNQREVQALLKAAKYTENSSVCFFWGKNIYICTVYFHLAHSLYS